MGIFQTKNRISKNGQPLVLRSAVTADSVWYNEFDQNILKSSPYSSIQLEEVVWLSDDKVKIRIESFQGDDGSLMIVVEFEEKPIGKLEFRSGTRKSNSHRGFFDMSVHPDFQNQGIGAILLQGLIEWVRSHSVIEVIQLDVVEENVAAVSLYKKFQFAEIGRDAYAIKTNGVFRSVITMQLWLPKN